MRRPAEPVRRRRHAGAVRPPSSRREACRQALRAAAQIAVNVDELNKFLSHDLREPIRFGIGIHGGEVIVGDIGYRDHMVFTALGDPVNVAARLQDMTKALACEVVVSDEVRATAGLAADALPQQEVAIRGRNEPMIVRAVKDARSCLRLSSTRRSSRRELTMRAFLMGRSAS